MRLLLLTHRLPFAPNRGDRIRAYHLLQMLAQQHEVHLVSLVHDAEEVQQLDAMRRAGAAASIHGAPVQRLTRVAAAALALPGRRPLTHVLLHSNHIRPMLRRLARTPPDVVVAYGTGMAQYAVQSPLVNSPCLLDMVDVDSEKWLALAQRSRAPLAWVYAREARLLRRFEVAMTRHAVATTVVNDRERVLLESVAGGGRVLTVPNGIDLEAFRPSTAPTAHPTVVFAGVFNYPPNVAGAHWFVSEVWPTVQREQPDARLVLVGANPSKAVRRLARAAGVEVTGSVPDVRPFLWDSAVAVAPLLVARGLQNKVLEAVAAGLPCVVTPQVADGLPAAVRPACRSAHEATAFARHVVSLLALPAAARRAVAASADLTGLGWKAQLAPLLNILQEREGIHRAKSDRT